MEDENKHTKHTVPPLGGGGGTMHGVPPLGGGGGTKHTVPPLGGGGGTKHTVPPLGGGGGTKHTVPPLGGGGGMRSPFKKGGMFDEASPLIFEKARQLRKNMTHAETVLWNYLRGEFSGLRFRRQHPIGLYIADFYCHKAKLIIEVDGSVHNDVLVKEQDQKREKDLSEWGYTVIRFTNERIEKDGVKVLEEIRDVVVKNIDKNN